MMVDALTSDFKKDPGYVTNWLGNGGTEVLREFCTLPEGEQVAIMGFISNLPYVAQVKIEEQNYVLVHAGLNVAGASASGKVSTANVLPQQHKYSWSYCRFDTIYLAAVYFV